MELDNLEDEIMETLVRIERKIDLVANFASLAAAANSRDIEKSFIKMTNAYKEIK